MSIFSDKVLVNWDFFSCENRSRLSGIHCIAFWFKYPTCVGKYMKYEGKSINSSQCTNLLRSIATNYSKKENQIGNFYIGTKWPLQQRFKKSIRNLGYIGNSRCSSFHFPNSNYNFSSLSKSICVVYSFLLRQLFFKINI